MNAYAVANRPSYTSTSSGSSSAPTYVKMYDQDGTPYLKKTGDIDVQKRIQSACPPNVTEALRRASLGDDSLLHASSPSYGDFTGIPSAADALLLATKIPGIVSAMNEANLKKPAPEPEVPNEKGDEVK